MTQDPNTDDGPDGMDSEPEDPVLDAMIEAEVARALGPAAKTLPAEIVDELYLLAYCRFPTDTERAAAAKRYARPNATRRTATEDLMWALINTREFLFRH